MHDHRTILLYLCTSFIRAKVSIFYIWPSFTRKMFNWLTDLWGSFELVLAGPGPGLVQKISLLVIDAMREKYFLFLWNAQTFSTILLQNHKGNHFISMGKISKSSFDEDDPDSDDQEENSELLAKHEMSEKPNCIKFRSKPSIILKSTCESDRVIKVVILRCVLGRMLSLYFQYERKLGVLSNNIISSQERDSGSAMMKMRTRQQHSLFTASASSSPAVAVGSNFDVEAVKLNHGR